MRSLVVALVALLAVSCVATAIDVDVNEAGAMDENMSADEFDAAPFTPSAAEADEADVEHDEMDADAAEAMDSASSDEEMLTEDEDSDAADEMDGNAEFALLEAGADAQTAATATAAADAATATATTAEAAAGAESEEERRKKAAAKKVVKRIRAPSALKAAPFKFHAERVVADSKAGSDPEMDKLNLALAAVKEDILSTNKQITDERKWVIAVAKIISAYNNKMKRVEAHIIALRKEMKSLYRKKKQIENLKLQRALEMKLKEARDELATLTGSLKHVALKKSELDKSGTDLRLTIAGIQAQLLKLRGIKPAKKAKKAKKAKAKKAAKKKAAPRPAAKGKGKGKGKGKKKCGKGKRFSRKLKKCVKKTNKAIARI